MGCIVFNGRVATISGWRCWLDGGTRSSQSVGDTVGGQSIDISPSSVY